MQSMRIEHDGSVRAQMTLVGLSPKLGRLRIELIRGVAR